jgi:hypothetical protein
VKITRCAAAGLAAVTVLAGCGSSGPSHADKLACRAVWREVGIARTARLAGNEIPAFAPGAAAAALAESATGTSQPLNRDLTAAGNRLVTVNTPTTAELAPLVRDCRTLGITASNAENVG